MRPRVVVRLREKNVRQLAGILMAVAMAGAATAQEGEDGPFGGFRHDNTAPIEITSDSLEVQQANNVAIFEGEVVVGQGTLRLTAARVEVDYDEEQSGGSTGAIRRLRATGDVFLSNGSETAQGDWGEYDVETGIVLMGGSVVLAQGDNAVAGERLRIDMNTGVGRIEGGATASSGGRVKSVFQPTQD